LTEEEKEKQDEPCNQPDGEKAQVERVASTNESTVHVGTWFSLPTPKTSQSDRMH
jgi:hypothetical protein